MSRPKTAEEMVELAQSIGFIEVLHIFYKRGMTISIPLREDKANREIESLNLSIRPYNCLVRSKIEKMGQLVDVISSKEIAAIKNLNKKSIREILLKTMEFAYLYLDSEGRLKFMQSVLDTYKKQKSS